MARDTRRKRPERRDAEPDSLAPKFEGRDRLDELLATAGSLLDCEGVFETFQEAQREGAPPAEVFPVLFDAEPRFPNADTARRLYENLFGLWALASTGAPLPAGKAQRPPKVKRERPPPPTPFGSGVPDAAFVQAASRYLEGEERVMLRLNDAFENRQDAMLGSLDAAGLSDEGYVATRQVLFELFAMLELGLTVIPGQLGKASVASVPEEVFEGAAPEKSQLPEALGAFVEESLQQKDLPANELEQIRLRVLQGAVALWRAARR